MRAGIALGANLGDRQECLTNARTRVFACEGVRSPLLSSSLYETEPIDCEPEAPRFLNAVIEIGYEGSTFELLEQLQRIEREFGRPAAHERNRSRTIDLDLLYHGSHTFSGGRLELPHPRIAFRAFVLQPLAEIRPNLILPGETRTVQELAAERASTLAVVRLPRRW